MPLRWQIALIICLSAIIYLPFVTSPFIWDDEQFIVKNVFVTEFNLPKLLTTNTTRGAGLVDNYYRPLTSLTFALDYQFWQLNPIGYHLINWLLHTSAALVLFFLLRILKLPNRWPLIIAVLFTIHPIQTESVSYINSRGDSLYSLLLLSSLLCLTQLMQRGHTTLRWYERTFIVNRWWLAILSLFFCALSILAKEIALAGVGLIWLAYFTLRLQKYSKNSKRRHPELMSDSDVTLNLFQNLLRNQVCHPELDSGSSKSGYQDHLEVLNSTNGRRSHIKHDNKHDSFKKSINKTLSIQSFKHFCFIFKPTPPQLLVLLGSLVIVASYLTLRATALNFADTFNATNQITDITADPLPIRALTFTRALFQYSLVLIAPFNSHMEHVLPSINTLLSPFPWLILLALLCLITLSIVEWRLQKTIWLLFGSLWFLGLLIPVSGIIPINGTFYEHWLYLPQVGFWLAALALLRITRLSLRLKSLPWVLPTLALLVTITLVFFSLLQNYRWADPVRFYTYTLQFSESARLHNNLGMSLAERGQVSNAIPHYQRALEISNTYPQIYHNLGNAYREIGNMEKAQTAYEVALALDPNFFHSFGPLFLIYIETNQPTPAQSLLDRLLSENLIDSLTAAQLQDKIDDIDDTDKTDSTDKIDNLE